MGEKVRTGKDREREGERKAAVCLFIYMLSKVGRVVDGLG